MEPQARARADVETQPLPPGTSLLDLGRSLARAGHVVGLLETLGAPGPSLLVWDPVVTLSAHDGGVRVEDPKGFLGACGPSHPRDAPRLLQQLSAPYRTEENGSSPPGLPFVGGWMGFCGYEWSAAQEGPTRAGEDGVPDLWFGLFDHAAVRPSDGEPLVLAVPSFRGTRVRTLLRELGRLPRSSTFHRGRPSPLPSPRSDLSRSRFESMVRDVRRRIRQGEVYQVDIARRVRAPDVDPWDLYMRLREGNPSPFVGVLDTGKFTIVSGSPEELVRVRQGPRGDRWVSTRPIAGTRPRGRGPQDLRNERALRRSAKEVAEHTMIVDLERNDLGRICEPGSVEVDEWLTVERYSHVMHLVSNVRGRLLRDVETPQLFRAMMPGGSISGTPKIRATEVISEVEDVPRGAYTGSLGYLSLDGQVSMNLLIRSAFFPHGGREAHLYAGAGIVQDSRSDREWNEIERKFSALFQALGNGGPPTSSGFAWAPPHLWEAWKAPRPARRFPDRRVLLVDNYDSFTFNLAQYFSALGARVRVVRNDELPLEALRAWAPSHVVLAPGPGRPRDAGVTLEAVRAFEGTPLLGVCLGHESIVEAYGGTLGPARLPVHGKASPIRHRATRGGPDLLGELPSLFSGARYHSLVARKVPPQLKVTARTLQGEVMAVQHRGAPSFGVQFHPESIRTPGGMSILSRFLAIDPYRGKRV
ncbi:MAG: chorismate-binding protein [Euryarchaeota archaeon]|nr:chorismate-binding protein [Euryarchaeota archaeon]